jgi:hypothetical protein
MEAESQGSKKVPHETHNINGLPDFDKSLTTRSMCTVATISIAGCCLACFIASAIIFGLRTQILLYRSTVTIHTAEGLSFMINLVLTQCLESSGYVHAISLRWALFKEERLRFNTNLRLFTSSRRLGPNKWYINMISAGLQILSYTSTSMIFVFNTYPGDPYAYINPVALFALGLSLLGQLAIAVWCLHSTASSIPTWGSNALNTALASLHSNLQRRPGRCMLSVDQGSLSRVPTLPRKRQSCMLKNTPTIRWILGFIWSWVGLVAIWIVVVILFGKRYHDPDTTWHFMLDWNVDKGADNVNDLNDVTLGMDISDSVTPLQQLVLGILFVFAVQGLQTMSLHCTELLVNMWRDESVWRASYVQKHNRRKHFEKPSGARLKTGIISSAVFSGPYMILFVMKALLHWLLGQSLSPSVYVIPISDKDLPTFVTNSPEVTGLAFSQLGFEMLYFRLIIYTITGIVFGLFTTILALWQPTGPQPVTWGHLQTLADLIDDWTVDEDGNLWWGDKGMNDEGIRHAGTSSKKTNLGEIVMTENYEG